MAARAARPLPSEPHAFEGKRKERGVCGSGPGDPIHAVQTSAGGDLGNLPSKLDGMTNREAVGMLADAVQANVGEALGEEVGRQAGETLRGRRARAEPAHRKRRLRLRRERAGAERGANARGHRHGREEAAAPNHTGGC